LETLAARLSEVPPDKLPSASAALIEAIPQRVTLIAPDGHVIDDTVLHGKTPRTEPMENHATRPEIIQALREVQGASMRTSATTGETYVYVARRFPATGTPVGVIRLAVKADDVRYSSERFVGFIQRCGAVALSVGVLLSFVAALVVSRPLRRIAEGAR